MTKAEQAKIILESLDEYIQINWNFEEYYLKGIIKGLQEVERNNG